MLLQNLSEEILLHICQSLPKSDIESARLVSRRLSTTCSPFLVTKVYISPQRPNLETFTRIAEHVIFKTTVSEVVFDDAFFDLTMQNSLRYEAGLRAKILAREGILGQSAQADVTPAILAEGFHQYQRCCEDQTRYTLAAEHVGRLCAGLAQMRHVWTLSVSDSWTTRSEASAGVSLFRSKGPLSRSWNQLWLEPSSWLQDRLTPQGHPFIVLLRAASVTHSHITTLKVDPKSYGMGITHHVFDMHPYDLDLSLSVFQNMRHINLWIDTLNGVDIVLRRGSLAELLGSARCLESLMLGFDEILEGDVKFDLDDVVGDKTWENLLSLKLLHVALHQHQLSRLISRHALTLVVVELTDISFYSGSWSVTLRDVQDLRALESLYLHDLADNERHYDVPSCEQVQHRIMDRNGNDGTEQH